MAMLCGVKATSVLLEAAKYHVMMLTGDASGLAAAVYVAAFVKGILMFSVILLIGTGWSFIKPFLNKRDKRILMFVLPLQVRIRQRVAVLCALQPPLKRFPSPPPRLLILVLQPLNQLGGVLSSSVLA